MPKSEGALDCFSSICNPLNHPPRSAPAQQVLLVHPGGGGALPSNRLMGMCRWMGSHFHGWIDYNGVAFSIELLEWGCIFSGFGGKNIMASRDFVY